MNIVLTGFMASGKSKISKAIAAMSDFKLVDTDDMITEEAGMSINDIFSKYGEEYFRELEYKVICKAAELDGYVIATGGGVPLNKANIDALRKNGVIVNLAPSFETIKERLEDAIDTRPLLQNQNLDDIEKRFNERKPYYANCDYAVEVYNAGTPEGFAKKILDLVHGE